MKLTMKLTAYCPSRSPLFFLATALCVAACGGDMKVLEYRPLSPAERELRERVEALEDTVWEGTTVTAIVGLLLGAAVGGAEGAALGAEAGRLVGATAGRYVAHQQVLHDQRTAVLQAVAADLKAVNEKTAAVVASMRAVVAQKLRRRDNLEVMKRGLAIAKAQQRLAREIQSELGTGGIEPVDKQVLQHERYVSSMKEMVRVLTET